jgi:fructose-1,6-bisphosphatase/inositol monophosphatase family enzyme
MGVRAVRQVVRQLLDHFRDRPNTSLKPMGDLQSGKRMLTADKDAERFFERFLDTYHNGRFKDIEFFGEETLGEDTDLTEIEGTCVLVDALDGSDLYERNLGNWCSAATFFTPSKPAGERIRAAVVGLPDGSTYFATDTATNVSVRRTPKAPAEFVRGISRKESIKDASVCFYGQKIGNFLPTCAFPIWRNLFERECPKQSQKTAKRQKIDKLRFRIFNLAGIPMMMKMIDKVAMNGGGIDAVVDFIGQKAHDVVPGAFLAGKAGAEIVDLDDVPITINRLEDLLLKPNTKRLKYIIASSKKLKNKLVELNRGSLSLNSSHISTDFI